MTIDNNDYSYCNDYNDFNFNDIRAASVTIEMNTLMVDIDYNDYNDFYFNDTRAASVTLEMITLMADIDYNDCNDYNDDTRAASVTVLILISCLLCWMPASISHLLICPKV